MELLKNQHTAKSGSTLWLSSHIDLSLNLPHKLRKLAKPIIWLALILASICSSVAEQTEWFGLPLPPPLDIETPVLISSRPIAPAQFSPDQKQYQELLGHQILNDVSTIVGFSYQSRINKEVGNGQMWGRISGLASGQATADWVTKQFQQAGIEQVETQSIQQDADASLWLPLSWSLTLQSNKQLGEDVTLHSAMPLAPSFLPKKGISAPVIAVNNASLGELAGLSVRGKIVVQKVTPQAHMVFERRPVLEKTRLLFEQGALAVINIVDLPGNLLARDFNNCGGPCFNLGARDGHFLQQVIDKAVASDTLDQVSLKLELDAKAFENLKATNVIAVIPANANSPVKNENIIINAHMDAWFDGAGDNGDGLAVLVALARHFAKADALDRNLVFVASAGHHTRGLHGPRDFVAKNPDLANNAQVVINIEHIAQRNIAPARQLHEDGYRYFTTDANEAPIVAGISNQAPFLEQLIDEGITRFGVNFVSAPSTMASGEGGGYRQLNKAIVTTMQAPPLYHTSGESIDMISEAGLEKMAHFFAYFIRHLSSAKPEELNPSAKPH